MLGASRQDSSASRSSATTGSESSTPDSLTQGKPAALSRGIGGAFGLLERPIAAGSWIVVRFGGSGSQLARVLYDSGPRVAVMKWRRNSRSWTGRVCVESRGILRAATEKEIAKARAGGAE